MATSLPVDPMTLFPPVFERGWYGDKWELQYTYWQNPTRMTGGNPVIAYSHGGGWGFGGWNTLIEGVSLAHILLVYLYYPAIYGSGPICFDVCTFQTRLRSLQGVSSPALNSPQEVTYEGTNPGTGVMQAQGSPADQITDTQRFVQFLRDRADHFDIDPGDIVLWGESSGSVGCMNAAMAPSRAYTIPTETRSPWDSYSNSVPRGVLNWIGPGSVDPDDMHYLIFGAAFGLAGGPDPSGDVTRMMHDAAGDPSALCKKCSPIHRIAACPNENSRVKIFSVYDLADLGAGPPFTNPHDPRWFAMIDAACVARGIDHDGIDTLSRASYGGNRQLFIEATLPATKVWLDLVVS